MSKQPTLYGSGFATYGSAVRAAKNALIKAGVAAPKRLVNFLTRGDDTTLYDWGTLDEKTGETTWADGTYVGTEKPQEASAPAAQPRAQKTPPAAAEGASDDAKVVVIVGGAAGLGAATAGAISALGAAAAEAISKTDKAQGVTPRVGKPEKELWQQPGERWRRPKRVEPAKVAWKPKAGNQQGEAYKRLIDGGMDIEKFCEEMTPFAGPNSLGWPVKTCWGTLNYLFCTQRGYGLEFDGRIIKLIVPADERDKNAAADG